LTFGEFFVIFSVFNKLVLTLELIVGGMTLNFRLVWYVCLS